MEKREREKPKHISKLWRVGGFGGEHNINQGCRLTNTARG